VGKGNEMEKSFTTDGLSRYLRIVDPGKIASGSSIKNLSVVSE